MNSIIFRDFDVFIPIDKMEHYLFIIENKNYFYNLVQDLQNDYSEKAYIDIVDESNKSLKLSEYVDVSLSVLSLDINNKKNINALYRQIKSLCREELSNSVNDITERLNKVFAHINIEYSVDLSSDIDINSDDLLKLMNIKVYDNQERLLEKIYEYIKVTYELRKTKIFVFNSLYVFLNKEEIDLLLHNCSLLGAHIVDYESNNVDKNTFDMKKILDDDYCLIE